jgi:PAS domain S-box-containing protein
MKRNKHKPAQKRYPADHGKAAGALNESEAMLRDTNAYLENLINYANAPIIVWDPLFKITRFNHAFESLTGRKESEVTGKSLELLFPDEHVENSMALIQKTLSGERWETVEIKILNTDQSVRTVLWNSATLFEPDGTTPIATIAQGEDITARKQAEDELRLLNQTLEQRISDRTRQLESINNELAIKNKELEQFTFIASHDLQEPLLTLINFTKLLREDHGGKLDEFGNIYIDFIHNSATRMRALVKGLMDYTLWGKESEKTLVDCNKISNEVISEMAEAINSCEARINIQRLPVINGNEADLKMLFQNLISNAIKFRKKHLPPEINISANYHEGFWIFSFEDNGIGIQDKDKEKIFTIFKRLHNRVEYEGIGIGLAHCKKIVELHGGKIRVDSSPGSGSTFQFTIPK